MLLVSRQSAFRQAQRYFRPPKTSIFARILSSLTVLEQREGKLQSASLSAVTAAQKLGGPVTGFVAGSQARAVAEEAAKVKGLEKIIVVENGVYDKVRLLWRLRLRTDPSNPFAGSP